MQECLSPLAALLSVKFWSLLGQASSAAASGPNCLA